MGIKKFDDISEIEKIIARAMVCHIGLADGDQPYVVPVCFGYERGKLYFHSRLGGRKIDIINRNPRVCFEMAIDLEFTRAETPCDCSMKYRSVIGFGKAHILDDEEKSHGLNIIMNHYNKGDFAFEKTSLATVNVIRIDITRITGKQIQD
ncbi:MAG: pyridoxamine 5'-phosphate oxidase family protein [Dehalococcoidales bacterium]|nr:pyridoxamine 5'-phosphate oxidase family protein [Dehalococcoidales bacterium]